MMTLKFKPIYTLAIAIAIVLGGCSTRVPEPVKPTDCDQDCVRNCLTERDCCMKACNYASQRDKSDCKNDCTSELQECYTACQEAEQGQ